VVGVGVPRQLHDPAELPEQDFGQVVVRAARLVRGFTPSADLERAGLQPHAYVLAAWALLFGVAAPVTDSVVVGYRLAMTPGRLVGRVESVRTTISLVASPLGPLVAGWLLQATSPRPTVAVFAAGGLALALWGTLSRSIRDAPSLRDLQAVDAEELRDAEALEAAATLEPTE